jgi:hypothetical protein
VHRVGHIETDRPDLKDHAAVHDHHAVDTTRLLVTRPDDIANPQAASRHLAHRHVTTNRTPRNIRLGAHADPAFVHADELIWCGRRGRGPS